MINGFATQGLGSNDEQRVAELIGGLPHQLVSLRREAGPRRVLAAAKLADELRRGAPALTVMEGTGLQGGLAVMLNRRRHGIPYVVSTGDAVGPFIAAHNRAAGPPLAAYERALFANSAGVIGWTPYLVGRGMTLGAPCGITIPGWAPFSIPADELTGRGLAVRERLGISQDALVVGIAGSLIWNERLGYSYGLELIKAAALARRDDLVVLIVGNGSGFAHLRKAAGELPAERVVFTGRVSREEVPDHLAAMDIGSLPQSVDAVGNFRYTTKLPEYLAADLPVMTGRIPAAYDLDGGWIWRISGDAPWLPDYHRSLAQMLDELTPAELVAKRLAARRAAPQFARAPQIDRVTAFLGELSAGNGPSTTQLFEDRAERDADVKQLTPVRSGSSSVENDQHDEG